MNIKNRVKRFLNNHKNVTKLLMVCLNKKVKGNIRTNAFLINSYINIGPGNNIVFIKESQLLHDITIRISGNNNEVIIGGGIEQIAPIAIIISGDNNKIEIGAGNVFSDEKTKIVIYGDSCEILLNSGHSLFKGALIKCHDISSRIHISNGFSCAENTRIISAEGKKISIGKDFFCSYNVEIRNTDSHTILDNNGRRINNGEDIIIGDHVWCAQDVIMLKGTEIASECVIGAKSLINKKFSESNSIIAGAPATIVKRSIHWIKDRNYIENQL